MKGLMTKLIGQGLGVVSFSSQYKLSVNNAFILLTRCRHNCSGRIIIYKHLHLQLVPLDILSRICLTSLTGRTRRTHNRICIDAIIAFYLR